VEYRPTEKAKELVPIFKAISERGTYLVEKDFDDGLNLGNNHT